MMRRLFRKLFFVFTLAVALGSCSSGPKVIPVRKMEKIYREMFLADQWLEYNPDLRRKADTSWFYEPIFSKYGYTVSDYRHSVDHYLKDPRRYAEMVGRVSEGMRSDADKLSRAIAARELAQRKADSIAIARKVFTPDELPFNDDFLYAGRTGERVEVKENPRGGWMLVLAPSDTFFRGPKIVIREQESAQTDPGLKDVEEAPDQKKTVAPVEIKKRGLLIR